MEVGHFADVGLVHLFVVEGVKLLALALLVGFEEGLLHITSWADLVRHFLHLGHRQRLRHILLLLLLQSLLGHPGVPIAPLRLGISCLHGVLLLDGLLELQLQLRAAGDGAVA